MFRYEIRNARGSFILKKFKTEYLETLFGNSHRCFLLFFITAIPVEDNQLNFWPSKSYEFLSELLAVPVGIIPTLLMYTEFN